jgi:hypothetical protein
MIRMTMRVGMERKRKILIDTSSRAFQVLRISPMALSHSFPAVLSTSHLADLCSARQTFNKER